MRSHRIMLALVVLALVSGWSIGNADAEAKKIRGSGSVTEERHNGEDFHGVAHQTIGKLHIVLGKKESLRIEAEENLQEYFEVEVSRGILEISTPNRISLDPSEPVHLYLTAKRLDTIHLSGPGDVVAPELEGKDVEVVLSGPGDLEADALKGDNVWIRISGPGDVEIGSVDGDDCKLIVSGPGDVEIDEVRGSTLDVRLSGPGDVEIRDGEVTKQDLTISGPGDYMARGLKSSEVIVDVSGPGDAVVYAEDVLEASVSGPGGLRYRGDPKVRFTGCGPGSMRPL
jgi:hypothetical protein